MLYTAFMFFLAALVVIALDLMGLARGAAGIANAALLVSVAFAGAKGLSWLRQSRHVHS
jgi:hypothetical protein